MLVCPVIFQRPRATGGLAVRRMVLAPVGRAVCPEWHAEKIASQRDKTWDTEAHAFILPWTDEVRLHSTAVRPAESRVTASATSSLRITHEGWEWIWISFMTG
jgi:hypothetical protein